MVLRFGPELKWFSGAAELGLKVVDNDERSALASDVRRRRMEDF